MFRLVFLYCAAPDSILQIYSLPAHANAMHGIITEASASLQQSQTTRLSATNENVSPNLNVGGPPPDSSKGNALRAERQREIALSRLKAKTRINPILNDVLREIG